MISGCYATAIGSNRSLVRSPLAGYLGGSAARYVKVKEAEKPLMSAQNSSFEVRRRGAPSSASMASRPHGGLCMSRSELLRSRQVGPAQGATAATLGCSGGHDSRFVIVFAETFDNRGRARAAPPMAPVNRCTAWRRALLGSMALSVPQYIQAARLQTQETGC